MYDCPVGSGATLEDEDKCILTINKKDNVRQDLAYIYVTFSTSCIIWQTTYIVDKRGRGFLSAQQKYQLTQLRNDKRSSVTNPNYE